MTGTINSLVVNLYGGPGTGKSTTAAGLFFKLKVNHINAEIVHEFAKDLTWEERHLALSYQPYVISKQAYHIHRLLGKVDVIITDSPILLGMIYRGEGYDDWLGLHLLNESRKAKSLNIFLERDREAHKYNPAGRKQTEAEAAEVDQQILELLRETGTPFERVRVAPSGAHVDTIFQLVLDKHLNIPR